MKLEATIVVSFQARSLAEAGETLDDVLGGARERDDVEIQSVELRTPVGAGPVTLPQLSPVARGPAHVPHPRPDGAG
jgi:hypothetical protein